MNVHFEEGPHLECEDLHKLLHARVSHGQEVEGLRVINPSSEEGPHLECEDLRAILRGA